MKPIGSILYFSEQAALAVPYLRPRVAIERAHYAPARLQKVADAAVALADALAALKTDDEAQKESEALYREAVRINLKRVLCVGTMVTKNSCH